MEDTSNKQSDNVNPNEVNESESSSKEASEQNTKTADSESNKSTTENPEINETSPVIEEVPTDSVSAMEIVDSQEISLIDNENENKNIETEMEVDTLANTNETESNKENPSTHEEEINKNEVSNEKENIQYKETENDALKNVNILNEDKNDKNIVNSDNNEELVTNKEDNLEKEKHIELIINDSLQSTENSSSTKKKLEEESTEKVIECVDIDMENETEKEVSNAKNAEVEKTEFVQITQDKDDSQLENQPEAEDPFGSDNLTLQIDLEPMEVDSASNNQGSKATEEQVKQKDIDNKREEEKVQDVLCTDQNVKDSKKQEEIVDKVVKSPLKTGTENSPEKITETLETVTKTVSESTTDISKDKSSEKKDTISATSILPGQDDEVCIIPDNTKENKTSQKPENDNAQTVQMDKNVNEDNLTTISQTSEDKQRNIEAAVSAAHEKNKDKVDLKVAALTTGTNEIQVNVNKSLDGPSIVTSDIIDIEDDAKNPEIEEITPKEVCKQCKEEKSCKIKVKLGTKIFNVCSEKCKLTFTAANNKATDIPSEGVNSKRDKRCANCLLIVESKDERNLSWETMEFCNEECLKKFQTRYGSYCRNCNGAVQSGSLGKYCIRFGYDVRQFCCSTCLEEFKKGLKICSYCQKDISTGVEGFLAPVGDKGQFKDFCVQDCMEKYSKMNSTQPCIPEKKVCGVCQEEKVMHCEVQIDRNPSVAICSEPCFAAFKFVNKVDPDQCSTCKKYFQLPTKKGFVVFYEDKAHTFCNKTCLNAFIITNRKLVTCRWCKVKKYNFDMIKKEFKTGQVMMCSLNCLALYQVSINVSPRRINCDFCKKFSEAEYHLTMSDATLRNFCSYNCVMNFQAQYTKSPITIPTNDTTGATGNDPVPTGIPKRAVVPNAAPWPAPTPVVASEQTAKKSLPVISSVTSLATMANGQPQSSVQLTNTQQSMQSITIQGTHPVVYKQQVVTRPTSPVEIGNKMTQCAPKMHTKGVSVRPIPCNQSTQTEGSYLVPIPIPIPVYVPFPCHMYSMPFPIPVPIPLPIPVPIFIPTTRNSAKGILKEIKRIQEKIPADPFEAELLMMAEMVATDKKNESDSDSNDEAREGGDVNDEEHGDTYSPEAVDSTHAFGDEMLQMALKMATELEEPAVDLETALTPSTIQTPQRPQNDEANENEAPSVRVHATRGRKRGMTYKNRSISNKRSRRSTHTNDVALLTDSQSAMQARFAEPTEKPDANMALKYTFGVNAWRQWVITKNAELEKQSIPTRKLKLFKTDLLQLTADELNYSLCLFVKEVRKPNGAEYAPDTIYYLCLGIQEYLFENNRIDNIFTDAYYEKFTDCLNEIAKKFTSLYNDALYVVTRVEEEHLWECKQLGAHSPHVLLNTLMYFNTKHFNLVSVEEHMQLSFSHIMKHWKRNPGAQSAAVASKVPGSRNVLLRFYPPQSTLESNSKKKKVYEQQENEDNPLRCPVKLYEFYLSKCPESVKTRNDVFYLLPERSCVPDSPVWYSTSPLAKDNLIKMLHRIKMVKEINVALLSC